MKMFTRTEAASLIRNESLSIFLNTLANDSHNSSCSYYIPVDSGKKTALARLLAFLLAKKEGVCIYITGWGIWGSAENFDLFDRYRRSFGEERALIETPLHFFASSEEDAFVSILSMALYFIWDAQIFDVAGDMLFQISHDEWLKFWIRDSELAQAVSSELLKYDLEPKSA